MATVYKALDQSSGQVVVLKKVHTYDPERRERFTAEARLAAGVKHPNVVQVLYVTDDSLVAEWVEGADLDDVVADVGALPPELAAFVVHETALGLEAVHNAGILHRDVSAANVLLSLDGDVKLTDFGLASLADDAGGEEVRGTLGTLAPEVILGETPGPAADLFSLGAVLVHAVTGRSPFATDDTSGTLDAVLHLNPAAALVGDPRIPGALTEIAESLLEKDPSSRPASASGVAEQLAVVLEALGSPGAGHLASFLNAPDVYKSPEPPNRKRRPMPPSPAQNRPAIELEPEAPVRQSRRPFLLAAAALIIGVTGIVFATSDRGRTDTPIASTEEPPAIEPLEVESVEDDSLLAVADPVLEDGPTVDAPPSPRPPASTPRAEPPPSRTPVTPTPVREPPERPATQPATTPRADDPPERPAQQNGTLTLEVEPYANVRLEQRDLGRSPIRNLSLPPGEYSVVLTNDAFPPVPATVRVRAGEPTRMTMSLWNTVARVELRVFPWARVSVDGEYWDTIPPQRRPLILSPGEHVLTFEHDELGTQERRITVAEGERPLIEVNMIEE